MSFYPKGIIDDLKKLWWKFYWHGVPKILRAIMTLAFIAFIFFLTIPSWNNIILAVLLYAYTKSVYERAF